MGNQIAKKVIAFLEEACEKEVRTLLGEQRESRNLWNFLLLNEDQKKVIDRIKPRIPKRLLKFAVGPLFEGYADNSELQLYFSLATGVDIKNASRDSLKSIDEQILETKHTFTMFFLRLWSHKFAKKDTSSTIDDKKDILKSSILAQLRNLTTQASSDWESELLVELLGVFLTQATDKMVKGDLCSLVEGLCNAIAKYSNRDSTESTPSDLVVRNQIDKFVRLLGDLYLSADKEDQKTASMNRLCQIATGTKNLKGRLALLKSLMSSADISTLKVKDLSDLSENKPISRDLITFNKELMTEIPFSDCFQNLPFDGIKTVLHLGLFLIDQKGLLIYKTVANFIEWDRLTSSIHIKSKIDIPANRAISSATLKNGEMILLLTPILTPLSESETEDLPQLLTVSPLMLEKALEQPVQMAARTSFLNSSSGLNKSFSQFLAFAHEIGLKGDDENWVIDSEDWTIRASTIFYANDKLHLLNLFCCSSSYCVATISLLEAGPDGKILLVNEQLVKGSEDTYKFDYLTGVESDQIFHALPISTEKILIAGGNKRIILDLKSNTVTEISRQYQAAIGFDYLHNQLMTITNDHIYSMSLPKQEKIFFNSFMINSESHSPVRVKEPKQKAVDDHLLCLLGLKKKDPIDKTDWIEASVLIERLAVDLLQSFSETSQTLSDNQLASILLKERNFRVDEETFEELLSIIDMHFAKKTVHSFDDVLLETLVCILVGHLQVAEQITRQSQSLRSDPDLSLISLEIINKCLNLLLLIEDDSKERIKKLKIEGIKSIISLCQMKKTTNELSETLSQNHERFSQEFFSAASKLLANPKVTRRSEFTDLIEFALTLDSVGAEKSHLEVILKALETSCISAVEKELLENGQGLETRAEDLQLKISRIVQEKNIQRLTSEIFWNISSGTQSAVRDAIVAQALDSLWKQLSPKVMTSVTTGMLPDSARSCLWMDLLLDTCQYLILKDEENRRLTIASIPNFVTLGLELVKVACKKDTNEPIQAGEFAGYSKERKPIEIEVSHEDSFIYVKLDPFKDYIIHLDRAEGDITYQLDILKPQLWKKAIPDRHEYSIIYYPHVVLSASHGRRIARVRGCWSIGLAAKPFAKEDLGSKKATVTLYSKDASSQNKPVLFSNIFLSFMVGKELPDPPFLGDSILELPVKGASMAEEEDAKRTYLKSLKLAKPLTPMDSANFCKSSITVDQHVGQLEGYLTQVDAHIGMLDLASDLLETSAPIAACFSFARRLLQVKCQSERLQPAKLRLLNRLLQHPQLGWLVLATQAPAAFSPDLLSSTFAALGNLSDACFSDRQTVLSFFHLAALVSRCSLDEHQLTALKDLLGRVGLLHKEPSVNLQVATDLHVTASAYEDIDSMAKFKTGQKVSAASEGDSVSHNTNVKTLYMSDNNEGSSLQNDNDDEDDSSSSSIKPAGKKSQSESKSSSDSDDNDDDDSSSDSDTSKAKKKDAKADESKNTMKATNDLDHENLNSPMSPISLAVPMVEKELKLTLKESYPQPPANLKQSEADKASQLLEVMALLGEAKSLDPYFDLRLLPPSNLLLVSTLSKLLLERLADQVSKNTFYFGSDPLGLPYYKLDEAAGLNVAVLKDTVIDWSSKYHSRTECPAQLWFNTFKRSTFGSIFGGITMPGPDVYPVRSCVDGDWKGNEVLELLTSRNIDQIKQKFESIKEDWKPLLAEQDIALMVESSADLWQKLHSNKVTQVKTKESDENLEIVENKFSKLKAKLRPPKVEVQKEKKLSLPSFYLDTCPVTSRLSSKLPICNVKLIQEELLQRLIQELVAFNLPHLELESDFLVSIAEAAFTRQAVLDFYEKSNLEPSAIYLDNLARAIPDSSLHAIQRKLFEGIKHANEWILLGQFRLVQHVVNISIEKKHRSMVEKVNSSLVLCFDIVDSLLRLELKNSPQRRNLILDAFEWFHTLFNARDTAASKGILDTKAEQIEEMMTVMDAAYFDGFLNSCEDTGDHLEAFISMSIRAELISKEKVESFTNVDSRFIIRMMQIYRELASYSLGKTFEEIKDQVIRGILMQKVSNETDKALPQSTKYILAPRIPLKINLAPEYSEFALRDLRLEKSNKEENDEDEESGVSCQIYESSNPEKKINLAQVYSAFNQNDISIVPELPSKASVEDWPVRDCQLKEREFVIVFPPVSKNAFILIEEDGVIALDETKMEQLSYYYDSKSAFNTANKSVSLWDSIMISGYIYANNGLINNLPITLSHFDETGLFFYNESLSSFELFCPFDDSLQRKFKAFAESDRVFFQVHSPIEARPTQITFVKKFQYFIMFETGQLLHVTFEKDGLESGGWAEALWSKYGDPQQRKLNEVSEAEGMDNQSILGKWKNSHDNQMRIYDFSKKYLKSIVPGSECVALLFDSPNSDTYLLNIIASLEKETTISIPKKEISRFIAHYQSEDNPDLTQFHILFSDGSLMLIEARNDRSDNWVKYATVSSDYKVFSMATFNNKVCVLASDKNKENKVGLYHVTANETGDKLSARLDIHDLGSAFLFNERSCIHDSPTFFATECSINPLCVFKKYNQLLDYPLSFSLNKVDQKIQFSSYAGDPDFFEKFQSENIDDNSIAFMLTAPCNWTIGGQKNDDCQPLVEFFLKSYNESSAFTEEDVDANTDRYSIDGAETLIQSSAVDFSGVIPPRVVVRVRGKKKQEFSTLSNMKFECPETDPAYFEIMPNLILLKGQEWERYKEETRIIWEPELNSITPSQWIEVKDTLVDLTWNIAFDDNPYSSKVYSETHKVNNIKQELKDLLPKVPYFTSHPQVQVNHLLGAHCSIAIMDYWTQCYTVSSRFVRRKPVSNHLDNAAQNMFGSTINEMRFHFSYCDSVGNFEMQVDRYRAEKCTELDQNQSFLNQLYYQIMVKANWNSVILKKMEGIELNFVGEDGYDAGGLLKEYFSQISNEVTKTTKLFVPSANFGDAVEENDRYVPNPELISEKDLGNFYKFGVILGFTFKFFGSLAIDMPACFWEHLLGNQVGWKDIANLDSHRYIFLENIMQMSAADLESSGLTFVHSVSDSLQIELVPGGSSIKLNSLNCLEYAARMKKLLVDLVRVPYNLIKSGFYRVISFKAFREMSPKILETVICGAKKIDLDWLKSITVGTGLNMDESKPITSEHEFWSRYEMFWEVLKTFTESQLIKYLQFVTGSSRITKAVTTHTINFDSTPSMLPLGHTCYNTIDIGIYQSAEELRKKLIFAIEHHSGFMEDGFSNGKKIHEDYDLESTPQHQPIPLLKSTMSKYLEETQD